MLNYITGKERIHINNFEGTDNEIIYVFQKEEAEEGIITEDTIVKNINEIYTSYKNKEITKEEVIESLWENLSQDLESYLKEKGIDNYIKLMIKLREKFKDMKLEMTADILPVFAVNIAIENGYKKDEIIAKAKNIYKKYMEEKKPFIYKIPKWVYIATGIIAMSGVIGFIIYNETKNK